MNARQRRKVQKIKAEPWPSRSWHGKSWSGTYGWVRVRRSNDFRYALEEQRIWWLVQAALKQGRVHTRRRLWCGTCGKYRGWMNLAQDCPECAAFWRRAARDGSIAGTPRPDDIGLCLSATEEQ